MQDHWSKCGEERGGERVIDKNEKGSRLEQIVTMRLAGFMEFMFCVLFCLQSLCLYDLNIFQLLRHQWHMVKKKDLHFIISDIWLMNKLNVISYSVHGLNHPVKKRKLLGKLKKLQCSLALIQSCHLTGRA